MNVDKLAHPKYRSDIDGLRAIAILSVIGFHAFGVMGGFSGVDVFFVISGYLITTIIYDNLKSNRFSFWDFYSRRIRRIFPSLSIVFIVCIISGWMLLYADEYEHLGKHILTGSGFISNITLFGESGYFDVASDKKPLLHLWSLGIEEQYYIFWPLLVFLFWKYKSNLGFLLALVLLLSFGLNVQLINIDPVATFYLPHTRFWELLVGSTVAYLMVFKKIHLNYSLRLLNLMSILGFGLISTGIILLTSSMAFPGWWALLPTIGAALIIFAGPNTFISQKFLSNSVLVWFGLISFPLYLWHWPLLSFLKILDDKSKWGNLVAVFGAIILAWLSQRYIEKPLRFGRNGSQKTIGLIVVMLLIGLIGLLIYRFDGFPGRINDGAQGEMVKKYRSQIEWPESNNYSKECVNKFGIDQYCLVGNISLPPTSALLGDSHANHFYFGLNKYVESQGGNLILFGAGACLPFFGVDRGRHPSAGNVNCYARTHKAYEYILNTNSIKTVFFSFVHTEFYRDDVKFIDRWEKINGDDNYRNSVEAFVRTINLLEKSGKQAVLIYDLPNLDVDPKQCFSQRPFSQKEKCELNTIKMVQDFERYDKMIEEVKTRTNIQVFETHPFINENFPVDPQGNLTYRDSTHLSMGGSMFFADKFRLRGQ